jgi:hypothetical protein
MSAQIIPFPIAKREPFDCLGSEWMYLELRQTWDEDFSREWAAKLGPTVRSRPEDLADLRARIAELAKA